jgi:hypothetical protein
MKCDLFKIGAVVAVFAAVGCTQNSAFSASRLTQTTVPFIASSVQGEALYYHGEGRIISLLDGTVKKEPFLLIKRTEPEKNLLSEIACVLKEDGNSILSPVYMRVDVEKGTLLISSAEDFNEQAYLSGTGTVAGQPWKWNVLRFAMDVKSLRGTVKVVDSNWVVGKSLIARKEILAPNGMPVQLWEVEAQEISQAEYASKATEAHCPNAQ